MKSVQYQYQYQYQVEKLPIDNEMGEPTNLCNSVSAQLIDEPDTGFYSPQLITDLSPQPWIVYLGKLTETGRMTDAGPCVSG